MNRRRVILFTGHMIDRPGRMPPRFPSEAAPAADLELRKLLNTLIRPNDLAISGAACGGDLLFDAAALERGAELEVYLPLDREHFVAESVSFAGEKWVQRFNTVLDHSKAKVHLPDATLAAASSRNPFVRCNLQMLERAIGAGPGRLHVVCLWDGKPGDGDGGTQHMAQTVLDRGGRVHWLDTNAYLK